VPDHRGHPGIDELLRHQGADLGIALVVLAHHPEDDGLAADLHLAIVGLLDRERHAVLVVLALVRDRAGERARVADGDGDRLFSPGPGRRRVRLSTSGEREDQRKSYQEPFHVGAGLPSKRRIQPLITR
jgi:hypothetical protein